MDPEWKSVEDYYLAKLQNEKAAKERAQELVRELTGQLEKKNQEIQHLTFRFNVVIQTLRLALGQVDKLRKVSSE